MNILLVIPKKFARSILPAPDIGLAYVARAAFDAGANVEILDAHKDNITPETFDNILKRKHYDLIGFKCLSVDFYAVLEYCRTIKRHNPNIITVLGSYHPTALPEDTMKHKEVDYVILGEGEMGISSLTKKLSYHQGNIPFEELSQIPCLVFRDKTDNNRIKTNPIALEENLDKLGFPAWHLFKIEEYPELPGETSRFLPIITSRGCPALCTFCCTKMIHKSKIRTRSPEHVIKEMEWLAENYDIQKISIFDDNFTFYKKHAMAICELYRQNNIPVKFDIPQGIRIDKIDKELLISLETAGCDYMGIGVESGVQKTLDVVRKGTAISDIKEKICLIKKYTKIRLIGFFVIGFPHETKDDILKTIDFALKLKLDYATFTIFTPFPGTPLFNTMVEEGYFSTDTFNWENLLLDRTTYQHKNMDYSTLKMLQRNAYIRFYFRPSKIYFFYRILFKEKSFKSYFIRFTSILRK